MTWLSREDHEAREARTLRPLAARAADCGLRRLHEEPDGLRTAFQRDRDRIIHSTAFRRLQHKTQVLAAFEGDHYRSRMTHSLEVAQMARGAAAALQLNPDLTEAIALAHDLGHPPFGHVGETGLHALMADHGGFAHNAQGLRILDDLEDPHGTGYGLNLVEVLRRSLLKGTVPEGFPVDPDVQTDEPTAIEAQLVDACDRIAYLCHDLDDGLRAGAFALAEVEQLTLYRRAAERAATPTPSRVISQMIGDLIEDLLGTTDALLDAHDGASPPRLRWGEATKAPADELQDLLRTRFYHARFVLDKMELGRDRIVEVFERLLREPERMPETVRARIDHDGLHRTVCDYVAGMTDRYLLKQ